MSGRFDKFFDYAYEKGRDIAKKFHGNKGDKMDKKGMNIESYDGQDAFYTGTDEEYEEFLKNVDVKTDNDADAEPVENTQRINLNETINIQSVIDKFKKKAGDIENGARKCASSYPSVAPARRGYGSQRDADAGNQTAGRGAGFHAL